jgi:hypothetical protein
MIRLAPVLILAGCAAGLAACSREASDVAAPAAATATSSPTLQEVMANAFTPQSNQIWELSGKLYDDEGNLDAALLSDEEWGTLRQLASDMRAAAAGLQDTSGLKVAAPGVKLQGEEAPGAADAAKVQALVDAAPEAFKAEAARLVEVSDAILAAVDARDANALDTLSGQLNEACASCHGRFWYPEQGGQ